MNTVMIGTIRSRSWLFQEYCLIHLNEYDLIDLLDDLLALDLEDKEFEKAYGAEC